ncbi:MAG: ATP-binding protein [Candidatus Brocadiales bacterium]|nr:ATP-binding protein [Candidatus Brocadiales bacterium]
MTVTLDQLNAWLKVPSETEHLEFKEAKNRFDFENLVEYCVALANEGGGSFVLGVTDKSPRQVVGTKAFETPAKTVAGIHERLHFKVGYSELEHENGRVLVFSVPSRPKGHPIQYNGKYLMRAGEELAPMSPEQLKKIFDEGKPDFLQELAVAHIDGAEVIRLLDTQSYFDLLNLPYPENRSGVLDRFVREAFVIKRNEHYDITNLGAILFAKSLDEIPSLSRKAVRVVVYEGVDKLKTRLDKMGHKGYAVGFLGLVDFINSQIPTNEVFEKAIRKTVKLFPEIAIRELVANALIHQDFNEQGTSVIVEIYTDRVEISNPGLPIITTDRFIDEYQSRNERLANVMRRFGICEELGSGIDKVVDSAEVFQLPAPDFRVGQIRTTAVLYAHREFDEMSREDRIRACYQHCCLRYVMNKKMTNQSLRERFNLSEKKADAISRVIRDASEKNLIKLEDPENSSRRYAKYVPFWA